MKDQQSDHLALYCDALAEELREAVEIDDRRDWFGPLWILAAGLIAACGSDTREPRKPFVQPDSDARSAADMGQDDADIDEPSACSSVDGCELTCDVLTDPGFCWSVGVAEAYACMAAAASGTTSADNLSCSDGDFTAVFGAAVTPDSVLDIENWEVALTRSGAPCAEFIETEDTFTLTTASTTAQIHFDASGYQVTCDGASKWRTTDVDGLLSCTLPDGTTALPGLAITQFGDENWSFQLLPESTDLFTCSF